MLTDDNLLLNFTFCYNSSQNPAPLLQLTTERAENNIRHAFVARDARACDVVVT